MALPSRDNVEEILKGRDLRDQIAVSSAVEELLRIIEEEESHEGAQPAIAALDQIVATAPEDVGAEELVRERVSGRVDRLLELAQTGEKSPKKSPSDAYAPMGRPSAPWTQKSLGNTLERVGRYVGDDQLTRTTALRDWQEWPANFDNMAQTVLGFWGQRAVASLELRRRQAGGLTAKLLLDALTPWRFGGHEESVAAILRFAGPDAVNLLAEALGGESWPSDRRFVLKCLAVTARLRAGGSGAIEALIATLEDGDLAVRKEIVPAVIDALELYRRRFEPSWQADQPLMAVLGKALADDDSSVSEAAAQALAAIGEPAADILISYLHSERWELRRRAVDALKAIGGGNAQRALAELRETEQDHEILRLLSD